jgi:hypothetical protein
VFFKIKQNNEQSDNPQNNPTVTPDTLSTELEEAIHFSITEVGILHIKKRCLGNEQKIALGERKLQQAPSAVQDKLQEALHVTLDTGDCGRPKNLKLIQLDKEYETSTKYHIKLAVRFDSSSKSEVNFTNTPQPVKK